MDPCSLARAFVVTDTTRKTIRLTPGVFSGNLVVANKTIDLHGAGATITATSGETITVNDAASLTVRGATVANSGATGTSIDCKSLNNVDVPRLTLLDARVESNGRGVRLWHCSATIRRTSLHAVNDAPIFGIAQSVADVEQSSIRGNGAANESLVLSADNSFLRFTNSILGSPNATGAATVLSAGGCILLAYSTVINATGQSIQPAVCSIPPTANGLCIENSIFANFVAGAPADTVTGTGAIAGYAITYPQTAPMVGPGNKNTNPMLTNAAAGDLHLKLGSPAIDAADPNSTQAVDYEGKQRPQGAGRDMGAFEYP